MSTFQVGDVVDVVRNVVAVEYIGATPRWYRTTIEPAYGDEREGRVFVKVDGLLVTRQLQHVRAAR